MQHVCLTWLGFIDEKAETANAPGLEGYTLAALSGARNLNWSITSFFPADTAPHGAGSLARSRRQERKESEMYVSHFERMTGSSPGFNQTVQERRGEWPKPMLDGGGGR